MHTYLLMFNKVPTISQLYLKVFITKRLDPITCETKKNYLFPLYINLLLTMCILIFFSTYAMRLEITTIHAMHQKSHRTKT